MSYYRQHLVWNMEGTYNDCGLTQSCHSKCWSCYLRPMRMTSNCGKSLYGRMLYSSMKMKFHLAGFCLYHLQCLGTGCETRCDNCHNQSPDHHHLPHFSQCLVIRNWYKKNHYIIPGLLSSEKKSLLMFNSAENIQIAFKTSILKHWLVLI